MKTPIQELIEHFTDAWSSPSDLWKPSKVIEKIESMLEREKQLLKDVYEDGREEEYDFFVNALKRDSFEDYYNNIFEQK